MSEDMNDEIRTLHLTDPIRSPHVVTCGIRLKIGDGAMPSLIGITLDLDDFTRQYSVICQDCWDLRNVK